MEQLSLITEALWTIFQKKGLKEQQLVQTIEKIKANKMQKKVEKQNCTGCKMILPASIDRCMYCGEQVTSNKVESLFL